ncbi:MAG: galactokinase [Acidobacteria bacterium]|nr:MAG: galactokinase [Acidobacteriota bacterium]
MECNLAEARLFRAPGRINLMGDHTDYNGGLVLPAAIDYETRILCVPSERVKLESLDVEGTVDLSAAGDEGCVEGWGRYIAGILKVLDERGRKPQGLTGVIDSSVPVGRGLSSSAALEVAFATAACALAGFELEPLELAEVCREAEERVAGVQCGIMDQAVAILAEEGTATLLDCATLKTSQIPIPPWLSVIAIDSGVERSLAGSSYNRRRRECEEALSAVQSYLPEIRTLSEIGEDRLDEAITYLDELHAHRLRHVITENARVLELALVLSRGAPEPDAATEEELRSIYAASQASLVDEYEAGHPNTNKLVEIAMEMEGCLGARQTGAGWGGSIVVIARSDAARDVVPSIAERYLNATGKTASALICAPAGGASEITGIMNQPKPT